MTKDQRRLIWGWVATSSVVVAFLVAGSYVHLRWLSWLVLPFALVARVSRALNPKGANINEIADDHPWLRWWAVACAVVFVGGAIFVLLQLQDHIEKESVMIGMFISIAVVMGPFVFLAERERFKEMGE